MNEQKNPDQYAELLRLTLPMMAKHRIPVTPENYSVWYQYVIGENPGLKAHVDGLIKKGIPFNQKTNSELFDRYGSHCNIERIEGISSNLHSIMEDVNNTLASADDDTCRFGGSLDDINTAITASTPFQNIKDLLSGLLSETQRMQEITRSMQAHILVKTREVEALQTELEREKVRSRSDPMTNLVNRATFFSALAEAIEDPNSSRGRLCLLMLDIDHFKRVNDSHGHLVGDRVIKFVAESIRKTVKGRDTAARYGGEEFALLLPSTPMEGARKLGQQLLKAISSARLMRTDSKTPLEQVTISIGLAVFKDGEDMMNFIDRADQALYQAKRKGRNRLCTELTL
jgi:diguanylate cyclase